MSIIGQVLITFIVVFWAIVCVNANDIEWDRSSIKALIIHALISAVLMVVAVGMMAYDMAPRELEKSTEEASEYVGDGLAGMAEHDFELVKATPRNDETYETTKNILGGSPLDRTRFLFESL
ncbi:hypothetical protein IKE72_01225 [Candidatus Saccharibacteria bacterium]|nr:hypothetical protein [Candidatus Saccharibacteria bacterium]